jgi:hypothetical protein
VFRLEKCRLRSTKWGFVVKLMIHASDTGWDVGMEVDVPIARILESSDLYELFREKVKEKLKETNIGG